MRIVVQNRAHAQSGKLAIAMVAPAKTAAPKGTSGYPSKAPVFLERGGLPPPFDPDRAAAGLNSLEARLPAVGVVSSDALDEEAFVSNGGGKPPHSKNPATRRRENDFASRVAALAA
jgi:hypothetical protein